MLPVECKECAFTEIAQGYIQSPYRGPYLITHSNHGRWSHWTVGRIAKGKLYYKLLVPGNWVLYRGSRTGSTVCLALVARVLDNSWLHTPIFRTADKQVI